VFNELDTQETGDLLLIIWVWNLQHTSAVFLLVAQYHHPYCLALPSLARPLGNLLPWKEKIEIECLQSLHTKCGWTSVTGTPYQSFDFTTIWRQVSIVWASSMGQREFVDQQSFSSSFAFMLANKMILYNSVIP
jgi:hypothetical protein